MLAALVGVFMAFLDQNAVNVAIAPMMAVFNTNAAGIEWVSTAYLLAGGMVVPLSGWLGDRLGLKRLYLWCLLVFTVGSVLCAASWSLESLIAARVLQALGGGLMMPVVMAMIFRIIPRDQMGTGMGIFGMVMVVAPALAPTLGGLLVEYVNWRWIFLINLPIGVVGALVAVSTLPEFPKSPENKPFDLPGAVTATLGFGGLLYVLSKGSEWGWTSEATVLTLVACVGILGLFVLIELGSTDPLLDLRVFLIPSFTYTNLLVIPIMMGMFAVLFYVPVFLQSIRGMGAMETGMLMFPAALATGLFSPVAGQLYDRFGPKLMMLAGILLMAVTTWLLSGITLATSLGTITWWLVLRGLAMGLLPIQMAAMADIPKPMLSRATAMLSILRSLVASFGIALMTVLLTQRNTFHTARLSEAVTGDAAVPGLPGLVAQQSYVLSLQDVFLLTSGVILLALVPAFFLKKKSKENP